MQKHVNLVDLVKSFPTNIFLQNLASIQKRTSPTKFDHLAEKSDKGSTRTFLLRWRAVSCGQSTPRMAQQSHDKAPSCPHAARVAGARRRVRLDQQPLLRSPLPLARADLLRDLHRPARCLRGGRGSLGVETFSSMLV